MDGIAAAAVVRNRGGDTAAAVTFLASILSWSDTGSLKFIGRNVKRRSGDGGGDDGEKADNVRRRNAV